MECFPEEMIIAIFKKLDWTDLFKMRKVSTVFKNTLDKNLKFFYIRFQKKYPECFLANCKYDTIKLSDFNHSLRIKYIKDFNKEKYHPVFVERVLNTTPNKLKLAFILHNEFSVTHFFALNFIEQMKSGRDFKNFVKLKESGFTDFFCKSISLDCDQLDEEKIELMCELKKTGFNDFYAKQAGLNYSINDLEMLKKIYNICKKEHFAIEMYEVMKQI